MNISVSVKKKIDKQRQIRFYNNCYGFHNGQVDCTLYAFDPDTENKKVYGRIDYNICQGMVYIQYVEVYEEFRRKGIATQLYNELKRINPDKPIKHSMTVSDEGSAGRDHVENQ